MLLGNLGLVVVIRYVTKENTLSSQVVITVTEEMHHTFDQVVVTRHQTFFHYLDTRTKRGAVNTAIKTPAVVIGVKDIYLVKLLASITPVFEYTICD